MAEIESAKIMYEIYQEEGYDGRYRVVYFTELREHNKEREINRAMAGRHVYDGFIQEWRKEEAKAIINVFVERLNAGDPPSISELEAALEGHSVG
ncbi:MAG: hypothetical protein ACE5JL_03210 [Dehalococcoidia bacterium]